LSTAPRPGEARPDIITLVCFLLLVVLIAANVVAIRFTNQELPPFWGAATRFGAASLLFFLIVLFQRLPLPRGRELAGTLVFGVLQFGLSFSLVYWALMGAPAGPVSVILASAPLFTLLFASAAGLERLRPRGIAGALVAIGGIAVMFAERAGIDVPAAYFLSAVSAALCFALVPVVVKRFPNIPAASMNAVGMLTGTIFLLGLALARGETMAVPATLAGWLAQLYLVVPGSLGVFALVVFLLRRWTASGVSYQAVLSPIVTILLSAWLLGEPLTGGLFGGSLFVIVGVYLGALANPGQEAPAREPAR
jgi:drug/metabolite transporter (DMT)-like permease